MSFYFPLWTKYVNTKELAGLFWEDLILGAPSAGGRWQQLTGELKDEGNGITMILPFILELNLLLDTQAIKPNVLVYKLASFSTKD